ncbi:hypothetical protein C7999DRAFT_10612 [Corynascus novoguineensis]|uniref:Carboxylesterase family protein n=1 Tax=Corynascus novoguineensis TaxID=1126955 RepID=A0AAN7HUK9_9PEZI|nr:hypothetical protein C7999DRAFT_10612 [Corynascus novoguineensis]
MATTSRPRPCVELDIQDDHHTHTTTTPALGEVSLNSIHNIRRRTSVESLARRLDSFHIHNSDKENKPRLSVEAASRAPSASLSTKGLGCEDARIPETSEDLENINPLALASQQVRSTKEQLSRHQEGQFEWLLSIPVKSAAAKRRRPRDDSHGDAELRQGGKTLYFGCNLVNRKPQSDGARENGESTDVYTLLATRVKAEEEFIVGQAPVFNEMEVTAATVGQHDQDLGVSKDTGLVMTVNEVASDHSGEDSRPLSRIEDSVEALDKLEEEIEAVAQVTQLERVLSPQAAARNSNAPSTKSTPMKRATSVRAPDSAKTRTVERSASVRKTASTGDDEKAATSSARKVPRPASLLPPKPLAKSSKPPTTSTFELPGEAVARRLKEQREQRRSQQISPEQAAALAAAYSPSKPHFKSSKPPTRPTFELPGEAISRKKREEREAKLRAQEEEERKRREFKARPIRASLVPSTVPRENLASLARQKSRATTEGSADSTATTVTPVSKKRQSATITATPSSSSATRPSAGMTVSHTLPTRGRNPTTASDPAAQAVPRAASTSTAASGRSGTSKVSTEEAAQQKLRGKEVFARDNSYTAEREREKRERERAAKEARERAAERSRELSRQWAEKQRLRRETEKREAEQQQQQQQ